MKENEVRRKSLLFARRIVMLCQYLCEEKREYVLSKQLLRSGTSIGANISEAQYASSRKDFLNKLYIALKESAETLYWLGNCYTRAITYLPRSTNLSIRTVGNFAGSSPPSPNPFETEKFLIPNFSLTERL